MAASRGEEPEQPQDQPWAIEGFLNRLADLLAPNPRGEGQSPRRNRRRQDIEDAATSLPRPAVDRPADEPLLTPEPRTRTRQPLIDPDNVDWDPTKWQAIRQAYFDERDRIISTWGTRLGLDDGVEPSIVAVDAYVAERRETGRNAGYVARLENAANAWRTMYTPPSRFTMDDMVRQLNELNPRRGRAILANAEEIEALIRNDVSESDTPEPDLPDGDIPEAAVSVPQDDDSEEGVAVEERKPFAELEEIREDAVDSPKMEKARNIVKRVKKQWRKLDRDLDERIGDPQLGRTRTLLSRLRRIRTDSINEYETGKFDSPEDAVAPAYVAQNLEQIIAEIDKIIAAIDHELPENVDDIDVESLIDPDASWRNTARRWLEETELDTDVVQRLLEQLSAVRDLLQRVDDDDEKDFAEGRFKILENIKELSDRNGVMIMFSRIFPMPGGDRGDRLNPPALQDIFHKLANDRQRNFEKRVSFLKSLLAELSAQDRKIEEGDWSPRNNLFVGDPRISLSQWEAHRDPSDPDYAELALDPINDAEKDIVSDFNRAIERDDVTALRDVASRIWGLVGGISAWLDREEADIDGRGEESAPLYSINARRRFEQLEFLAEILERIADLGIHNGRDERPLNERSSAINVDDIRQKVKFLRGGLVTDPGGDKYPSEVISPVPEIPRLQELDYPSIMDSKYVRDRENFKTRLQESFDRDSDLARQLGQFGEIDRDDIEGMQRNLDILTRRVQSRISMITEPDIPELEEVWEFEYASYEDRIYAGLRLKRLQAIRTQMLRDAVRLEEAIIEERQRAGADAPAIPNLPEISNDVAETLEKISDTEIRKWAKSMLGDIDQEYDREVIPSLDTRGLDEFAYVLGSIDEEIWTLENELVRKNEDGKIANLLLIQKLQEKQDKIENLLEIRRNELSSFIDIKGLNRQIGENWSESDMDLFLTLYEASVHRAGQADDVDIPEDDLELFLLELKRHHADTKNRYRSRLPRALVFQNDWEELTEDVEKQIEVEESKVGDESLLLLERAVAFTKLQSLLETKRYLDAFANKWLITDDDLRANPPGDTDSLLKKAVASLRAQGFSLDDIRLDSAFGSYDGAPVNRVRGMLTVANDQESWMQVSLSIARTIRDADESIRQVVEEVPHYNHSRQTLAYRQMIIAKTLITESAIKQELEKIIEETPEILDLTSLAPRHVEPSIAPQPNRDGDRRGKRFVDRVLRPFKGFYPQRRNRMRGQIAHRDGSPRNIENPDITDVESAIDHLRRGGSLDEVPNRYWLVAIDANSSDEIFDKSTRFYKKQKIGGIIGETLIYLARDDNGGAVEQGWVFKTTWDYGNDAPVNELSAVIGTYFLHELGLPVEGGGWDGVLTTPDDNPFTASSRAFFVQPYVGNALSVSPRPFVASDVMGGGSNFSERLLRVAVPDPSRYDAQAPVGSLMSRFQARGLLGQYWPGWSARLVNYFSSAMLGLSDRHSGNAVSFMTADGPVVIPIDLDSTGNIDVIGWMTYVPMMNMEHGSGNGFAEGPGTFVDDATRDFGLGLEVAWRTIQLADEMLDNAEKMMDMDPDEFARKMLEGFSTSTDGVVENAEQRARSTLADLRLTYMNLKADRSNFLAGLLRRALQNAPYESSEKNALIEDLVANYEEAKFYEWPVDITGISEDEISQGPMIWLRLAVELKEIHDRNARGV
jgi:hypothetical protein